MNIGGAVSCLRDGAFMKRAGWNGKGQYIGLQEPDDLSQNTLPYIYIVTEQGDRVPWLASQTDLLAEDWQLVI